MRGQQGLEKALAGCQLHSPSGAKIHSCHQQSLGVPLQPALAAADSSPPGDSWGSTGASQLFQCFQTLNTEHLCPWLWAALKRYCLLSHSPGQPRSYSCLADKRKWSSWRSRSFSKVPQQSSLPFLGMDVLGVQAACLTTAPFKQEALGEHE